MKHEYKCQMTISLPEFPGSKLYFVCCLCGRPAKFRNPKPEMKVEYVCGIHARSLDKLFERTGQKYRCEPL